MATIMEKESFLNLIAYATSIIALRLPRSEEYEEVADYLADKRHWAYSTDPEDIDLDTEVPPIQAIIKKYENLPILPQFR